MFQDVLANHSARVETCLTEIFDTLGEGQPIDAMRYAAMSGGKRLRAFLAIEGAHLYGVRPVQADRVAAAVECIHAYSLVHDDLPCMDDDDLRRGKPTVHVKWDEATAVLAGDGLQTLAFQLLASQRTAGDANVRLRLITSMAIAAGGQGMVLGQVQDIAAESAASPLDLAAITELQANKTGALFCWAAESGPILAGANADGMKAYASAIGLAFQIADDIMDIEGDAAKAGKRLKKDANAGKATFVSLLGMDGAKSRATELVDEACSHLDIFGGTGDNLRALAQFVIARDS